LTNPKDILNNLHLNRAGLASGLLSKKEVINWADQIIAKDEQPDIFFIELALLNSKSTNDILHYFNEFLNFENPSINGRPLLGLLYKQYKNGVLSLEQTVSKLFRLKFEAIFTNREESYIYSIDNDFDCAKDNIYGSIEDVQNELEKFLSFYIEYSISNFDQREKLDKHVEEMIDKDYQHQEYLAEQHKKNTM
jgi:hypothetical protein